MPVKIREDTWSHINGFLKEVPEGFKQLSTFREALDESARMTQQKILVRQLRRKFPQAPETVVQQIKATKSSDLLNHWLDEIIMANDLADTELGQVSSEE